MVMLIRTPLRVSLFGGGTDYPAYFMRMPGAVLGFAINKYIYVSALELGSYVDYRFRVSYSRLEQVEQIDAIEHPVVREALKHYGWSTPIDFSTQADMPASAGLGSSSAFTVGFINLLSHLQRVPRTRLELAKEAIFVERELLKENVGVQDQLHAAFGGMNRYDFHGDAFKVTPISISAVHMNELSDWLVLVYTGIKRRASETATEQVKNTSTKKVDRELGSLLGMVTQAQSILESGRPTFEVAKEIAVLLDQSWQIKKKLSLGITATEIDELYDFCVANGALGGKLCGAGGGGFLLMVVAPDKRASFEQAVGKRRCINLKIDQYGSQLVTNA